MHVFFDNFIARLTNFHLLNLYMLARIWMPMLEMIFIILKDQFGNLAHMDT